MEFKFRAVDDRPPAYYSPSSGIGNFSDPAFRGGYPSPDLGPNAELMGNPSDVREAIQRELEKERIREEMIAAEIARRRVLEAEVRRELMMEREMVMRRAAESGLSFEERVAMRFDPRYPFMPHPFDGRFLEDRWSFPGRSSLDMLPPPLQRLLPEPMAHELKPKANKDKIIFLAKPDPTLSGAKRKAATPPPAGASELSPAISKKKPKEEWSCALCQVSATSEKGLNEHLQGKKHKAKEAGLRAQRAAKNAINGQLPKKTGRPKPAEATGIASLEQGVKLDKDSLPADKIDKDSAQKIEDPEDNKNNELPMQKNNNAEDSKKKDGVAMEQNGEKTTDIRKKKKFKYWCEMCEIGAYSEIVMETHKKGKKHMARLKELDQNEAVPTSTTPETTTQEEDVDTAEEANEKLAENVTADANIPDSHPVSN